jgi:hypothetical protein
MFVLEHPEQVLALQEFKNKVDVVLVNESLVELDNEVKLLSICLTE